MLMGLGMIMLSPPVVSLPCKLLLFVMVDGWALICGGVAASSDKSSAACVSAMRLRLGGRSSRSSSFRPKTMRARGALRNDRNAPAAAAGVRFDDVRRRRFDAQPDGRARQSVSSAKSASTVMAHVTCVGATRAELRALFDDLARGRHRKRARVARRSAARTTRSKPTRAASHTPVNSSRCCGATTTSASAQRVIRRSIPKRRAWKPTLRTSSARWRRARDFLDHAAVFRQRAVLRVQRARARSASRCRSFRDSCRSRTTSRSQRFVAMCGATIPPKLRVEMEARNGDASGRRSRRRVRSDAGRRSCCRQACPASISTRSTVAGDARDRFVTLGGECLAAGAFLSPSTITTR